MAGIVVCTTCGTITVEQTVIPVTDHELVTHPAKEPTKTENGWYEYETCENCDFTTFVAIPATGNSGWQDGAGEFPTVDLDKVQNGEYPHEHTLVVVKGYDPTCTGYGLSDGEECSVCGEVTVEQTALAPTGHTYVSHKAQSATCTAIGWYAYETCASCDYSTYVEIPALGHSNVNYPAKAPTCTEVGWYAYDVCSRCGYSTYVERPAIGHDNTYYSAKNPTCTAIGWYAYEECSRCDHTTYKEIAALGHSLTYHEAKAPTATEVGWNAYESCSRCSYTTYVEIPELGEELVYSENLDFVLNSDGASYSLVGFGTCKDSKLVIPPMYKGLPVTAIADFALAGYSFTSVIIPEGVTHIYDYAFNYCEDLESVTLPLSVTVIGECVFEGCGISDVYYNGARENWNNISIADGNLELTGARIHYLVEPEVEGLEFILSSDGESYVVVGIGSIKGGDIIIPETYEGLPVTSIDAYAFENCSSITSVTIPASVKLIGASAFIGCDALKAVYIADVNEWFDVEFADAFANPLSNGAKLYADGKLVTDLVVPGEIEVIGSYVFYGCTSITSVTLEDGVTTVGSAAFYGCIKLESVTLPESVVYIESNSFYDCISIEDVYYGATLDDWSNVYIGSGNDCLTDADIHAEDNEGWDDTEGETPLIPAG